MAFSDWTKELQEFAHAAQVFRPASGIMASRFTSASSSTQAGTGDASKESNLLRTHTTQPTDPAEQAAKLGMYGPMTRSQFDFHPSRLLCKRFNVAPPAHITPADTEGDDAGSRAREPVSKPDMDKMVHEYLTRGSNMQRPQWMNQTTDIPERPPVPEHATVDVEVNEALATERAPEDVFKSIFGDDDDDE
jgi:G patch domain-containing protein 1